MAITGVVPLFDAMKDGMVPVPAAASPMAGVSFVQLKILPVPEKLTAVVGVPAFNDWLPGALTVGRE